MQPIEMETGVGAQNDKPTYRRRTWNDRSDQTGPSQKVPRLALDNKNSKALGRMLLALGSPYKDLNSVRLAAYRAVVTTLPLEVLDRIVAMRSEPDLPGALLLANLPIDPALPRTPADGGVCEEKATFVSEGVLLGIASALGLPFSFMREKDGVIIHSISPVQGREEATANDGSLSDFKAHVECAYFPFRPDLLLLLCLRPDAERRAGTLVADIRSALQYLSPWDRDVLRQPLFQIQAPLSFATGLGGQPWSEPRPVLTGSDSSPEVCLNLNGMRAVTPGAEATLDLLRRLLESPSIVESVVLEAGDLLIVDNRKSVHGRTPFTARFDGYDRWLQRLYVKVDVWPRRSDRGSEIVF
jgi:L-asparagine oxygenase